MKYFIAYTYTKDNNPFPLFGNYILDTEWNEEEWKDFLDGQTYGVEKLLPEYRNDSCHNLTLICVSEIK